MEVEVIKSEPTDNIENLDTRAQYDIHGSNKIYDVTDVAKMERPDEGRIYPLIEINKDQIIEENSNILVSNTNTIIDVKSDPGRKVQDHTCRICNLAFKSSYQFGRHKILHASKTFKCDTCGKEFIGKQNLKKHNKTHLKVKVPRKLECDTCGKVCRDQHALKRHEMTHLEVKPFPCSVCNYRATTNELLKKHLQKHAEGCPQCEKCGKFYKDDDHLIEHKKQCHHIPKPFGCEYCRKCFESEDLLEKHRKTHGEAKFICHFCGSKFATQENFEIHQRKHNKKFSCEFCNYETAHEECIA